MSESKMTEMVVDYISQNHPDMVGNAEVVERMTRAFIAGYQAAKGYKSVERPGSWRCGNV